MHMQGMLSSTGGVIFLRARVFFLMFSGRRDHHRPQAFETWGSAPDPAPAGGFFCCCCCGKKEKRESEEEKEGEEKGKERKEEGEKKERRRREKENR